MTLEDALPSTLSKKAAESLLLAPAASSAVAAAYYPDWAAGTLPPENIDFSKFDLIYFGERMHYNFPSPLFVYFPY